MHEVEYLVGLSVIIQVEQVRIIGLKMKPSVLVKNVQFDFHLQNEDIIAGKKFNQNISLEYLLHF
jgi:hypothetical protein